MSRLEFLYTYVANLVKEAAEHMEELPEGLRHYIQTDNCVIYHNRSEETTERGASHPEGCHKLCGCIQQLSATAVCLKSRP